MDVYIYIYICMYVCMCVCMYIVDSLAGLTCSFPPYAMETVSTTLNRQHVAH